MASRYIRIAVSSQSHIETTFKKVKKRSASLQINMQPLLLTLLIGTAFAMVNAAPAQNKLQSLQALLEGDDDIARTAKWWGIAKRVLGGINHAVNGKERDLAEQQEEDGIEEQAKAQRIRFGKLLSGAIKHLPHVIDALSGGEEELVKIQEDDDEKAKAQFLSLLSHLLG